MSLDGMEYLRRARAILGEDGTQLDGTARARVLEAADRFWSALFYDDTWPPSLREHAQQVGRMLLQRGTIRQTLETMDDAQLNEVQTALRAFLRAAETHHGDGHAAS